MTSTDYVLWNLHLRKSLGEALTAGEEGRLAAWYAEQDQVEAIVLGPAPESSELDAIKGQVDTILGRIVTTSQTIQSLAAENETLRRENTALRRQLAERPILQPEEAANVGGK